MTKSKTKSAILIGGLMLCGSAFADDSSKPWVDNPGQFAPDDLSAYGADYSRLHPKQDAAQAGPTLIAAGDGKTRPWVDNPGAYAPDNLSAYSGNYRLSERTVKRSDGGVTIAAR